MATVERTRDLACARTEIDSSGITITRVPQFLTLSTSRATDAASTPPCPYLWTRSLLLPHAATISGLAFGITALR